ncbi:MAG: hypothetical protein ACE5LU_21065, partial [Anaerolineae bacterium]
GDSCLLLFRENGEVCTFPVHTAEDFGLNPALVRNRARTALECDRWEARMQPGDLLLACTDAVGKWALECLESGQAGLLFENLLGLLAPAPSESEPSVEESSITDPSPPHSEQKPVEDSPAGEDDVKHLSIRERLWRLIQRPQPEQSPAQPSETDTPDSYQRATPEPTPDLPLDFEEFIERHRAPDSRPRMRNDDSTLVMCLPVRSAGDDQQSEVLEILRRHYAVAPVCHIMKPKTGLLTG